MGGGAWTGMGNSQDEPPSQLGLRDPTCPLPWKAEGRYISNDPLRLPGTPLPEEQSELKKTL